MWRRRRELIAAEPGRRFDRESELDLAVLAWAARFAFVTGSTLAWRWGVSEQKMRKRVRRLEREGFVRRVRDGRNQPARVVVTERGGDVAGWPCGRRAGANRSGMSWR